MLNFASAKAVEAQSSIIATINKAFFILNPSLLLSSFFVFYPVGLPCPCVKRAQQPRLASHVQNSPVFR
jgi:hypothetical protein